VLRGFRVFRLRSKAADLRTAFRILNADLMRYRIGEYTASELIETYSKVEKRIGRPARAAAPVAVALVPARRWLDPALNAPQRRREGLSAGAGFDLPVGHLPPVAGLDGLVRAPQRPSRRDSGAARPARYPDSNHGVAALGGARPAATWLLLREPGSPAQRLSAAGSGRTIAKTGSPATPHPPPAAQRGGQRHRSMTARGVRATL